VTEYPRCPQKTIDSQVQTPFRGAIMSSSDLGIDPAQIEQGAGLLEGDGALARGNSRQ